MKEIPTETHDIVLSSLPQSSWKQYETGLKKWWFFCADKGLDPYRPGIPGTLLFLTDEFNKGGSYGTLNSYRSTLALLAGPDLAKNYIIKRFFNGISKERPAKPRYDLTWDPKIVLDHYRELPKSYELPVKDLSQKLITMLALITGHRLQTFSLIKTENIRFQNDKVEIKIPSRIKTSGLNKEQPVLTIPWYKKEEKICVASALKAYLEKTRSLREGVENLFISLNPPFEPVSSQTLSRWVRGVLAKCKIDTSIFSGYSTRHASTSAAKR